MTLIKISALSDLGICQIQFLDKLLGKVERTPFMKTGEKRHEKLTEGLVKVSEEELIKNIKKGKKFTAREILVKSNDIKLIGRIDQIDFLGFRGTKKNLAIVSDDKFTRKNHLEIPNYYKLQLSGYTLAIDFDERFNKITDVIGAKLSFHDIDTRKYLNTFEVDIDTLANWEKKIPKVVDKGLKIVEKGEAEHKGFNIETGKWEDCWIHKSYF